MLCSPWCISRQLWWGHRIPAYKIVNHCNINESDAWIVARSEEEAVQKAAQKLQVPVSEVTLEQGKSDTLTPFPGQPGRDGNFLVILIPPPPGC